MTNTVRQIHRFFARHGSPVAQYAPAFVRYGQRYGVDPRLIAAIVMKETEGGLTGTGRPGQYNLTGVGGVGHMRSYPNYRASIADTARNLGTPRYRGKPLPVQTAMWVSGGPPTATTAGYTRDIRGFLHMLGGGAAFTAGTPPQPPQQPPVQPGARAPGVPGTTLLNPTGLFQQLGDLTGVPWTLQLPDIRLPAVKGEKIVAKAGPQQIPVVTKGRVTPAEQRAVSLIHNYLGWKYITGGRDPKTGGFDCSGLVQYIYGRLGVKLGNTTYDQIKQGHPVKYGQLRPGDIVFFYGPSPHHEGLYIGGGKFIHAPHTGDVVKISSFADNGGYYRQNFYAARRVA